MSTAPDPDEPGAQQKSHTALDQWKALERGLFIHFGMNTFLGKEITGEAPPSDFYAPTKLSVRDWVAVARDTGFKYAVLTTKHITGHCLWPSRHTDYSVKTASSKTDVVAEFVTACREMGVLPGFYYCSWDNHHRFGGRPPVHAEWWEAFTTPEYHAFMSAQVKELLEDYGPAAELWIDIPHILPRHFRKELYSQVISHDPNTIVVMNNDKIHGFPSDIRTFERSVPANESTDYQPTRKDLFNEWEMIEGEWHRRPAEVCTTVCQQWFHEEGDLPRDPDELLGTALLCRSRGLNLLLDVGPDKTGRLPQTTVDALVQLNQRLTS